ncbi:MAG TPA: ribose 5-phosphate isomerase B [Gemmataceae bacterium]|nr:ribose 5-phosphate isomerase B [Gemmataceae bacterium]
MRIAIGSDHRGYDAKRRIVSLLQQMGHEVLDLGTQGPDSVDYPDFAFQVAQAVGEHRVERGILICGTGIGMCIAANKVRGVRAAPCHDSITAEMSRRHNDANVLCLSADLLGDDLIDRMVRIWLETEFEGGRHARRVDKIARFEQGESSATPPSAGTS